MFGCGITPPARWGPDAAGNWIGGGGSKRVSSPAVQLLCTLEDKAASSRKNRLKRQLVRFRFDIRKVSPAGSVVALKNMKVRKSCQSRSKRSLPDCLCVDSGPSQREAKQTKGKHPLVIAP